MTENVNGTAADLTANLAALRHDVARLPETMSDLVQHQTQGAGLRISEAVGDAKNKISSTAAGAHNRVRVANGEIEASIVRNPLTTVLITFSIGMLVCVMTSTHYR